MVKRKILLVDDEEGFTTMLRLNLESTGEYEVVIENDSLKALTTALAYRPDLILLDVIMPHKEGPDIASEVKHNQDISNTPIVFLTATVTEDEVSTEGGRIGGHPFVAKPSSIEVLLESIQSNMLLS